MNIRATNTISSIWVLPVLAIWIWLFHPCLLWVAQFISREDYLLNGILLLAFCAVLTRKILVICKLQKSLFFQLKPLPLFVFGAGIVGYLLVQRYAYVNILLCICMGISCYGLCGLLLSTKRWHAAAPFVLLFILLLPFNYHLETFVGFPLRLLAAKISHYALLTLGCSSISVDSIVLLENKAAQVALPCSGLKSMWAGGLFFIFLSIVENYKLSMKWFCCMAVSIVCIVLANTIRILCLVFVFAAGAPKIITDSIHIPLGMISFTASCLCIYLLSRKLPKRAPSSTREQNNTFSLFAPILLSTILLAANFLQSSPIPEHNAIPNSHLLTPPFQHSSLPITTMEQALFIHHGVTHYQKLQYSHGKISGTLFLVKTRSWRGHHHPEQCIIGNGLTITSKKTHLVNGATPIHLLSLSQKDLMAAYWFVASDVVTDDYAFRVWAGITHPSQEWVMVSTYFTITDPRYLQDLEQIVVSLNSQLQEIAFTGEKE